MSKLNKCDCGGTAVYVGKHMLDGYKCDKCGWETGTYFDGEPYAAKEWSDGKEAKRKKLARFDGVKPIWSKA